MARGRIGVVKLSAQWRSLVVDIASEEPDLEPSLRNVLSTLIEVDAEVRRRGQPYPGTLAYLGALCQQVDDSLLDHIAQATIEGPFTTERLLHAFIGSGVRDWDALGSMAIAWLRELLEA